jgi:hypothetical protein
MMVYVPGAQMRSDNAHDLSSLDIALRLGDLQQMHYIQDLRVESFLLRHGIWVGYRSRDLGIRELCKSFFKIGPDDILRFEQEDFLFCQLFALEKCQ